MPLAVTDFLWTAILALLQAHMQTFKKRGANFRYFAKGGANLKKIMILEPELGG